MNLTILLFFLSCNTM